MQTPDKNIFIDEMKMQKAQLIEMLSDTDKEAGKKLLEEIFMSMTTLVAIEMANKFEADPTIFSK